MFDVSYLGALTAGILTFLSPCVLPLVPAYLCFISGQSLEQIAGRSNLRPVMAGAGAGAGARAGVAPGTEGAEPTVAWHTVFLPGLAFVLGLSSVFILLGVAAGGLSGFVVEHKRTLGLVGGAVIVVFGLHYMGLFRLGFLNFEKRLHLDNKPAGLIGAFIIGLAFGFGWTPCVGPVLSTILMLAAVGDSMAYAVSLLSTFAAGLGIPFLLAALATGPFMRFLSRFRRHMRKVELAMGSLLVLTGVLILTGSLNTITAWLLHTFPVLSGLN